MDAGDFKRIRSRSAVFRRHQQSGSAVFTEKLQCRTSRSFQNTQWNLFEFGIESRKKLFKCCAFFL